jgi:adenosylcobinamide-GDP ribazoletransferase
MGVTAVASVLAMKMAAAHSLAGPARWDALFLAALAGRCAMAAVMGLHPYAREAGVASPFQSGRGGWKAAWAFGCLLIAAGCLFRGRGEVMGLAAVVFVWGFSSWVRRKIGGYTGDTLGAVCELTEVFVLLSAAAV